mmetsp:Transcript_11699/g.26804  ORF Transcript_11699/g.26804 Transcript_11699/m.26804 type:complete len:113 (-) Transcript_11699:249-587(-)
MHCHRHINHDEPTAQRVSDHEELIADFSDEEGAIAELDFPAINHQFETSSVLAVAAPPRVFRRAQRASREARGQQKQESNLAQRILRNQQVGRELSKAVEARRPAPLRVMEL